jgi:3-oxoacyl-(acyl-carrier-protein) synthase
VTPTVEIAGFGSAYDAHAANMNAAGACDGARVAIRQALQMAGIDPSQVACIIASSSGSREGDATEAHALHQVFGDALQGIPICAPKAGFGEAMGGSGALCAVVAALALARQCLAPTAGCDGSAYGLRLSNLAQPIDGDYALVDALGCDGNNVALVLRRRQDAPRHEPGRPA